MGLNGTVVSDAHSEQVVRVSERTLGPPRARFALHCLQCFGSFVNCLSWKNSCSPAVNTNSASQSTHFNTRSTNSMAGFPKTGNSLKPAKIPKSRRSRFPVLLLACTTRARAAQKISGYNICDPILLNYTSNSKLLAIRCSFEQTYQVQPATPAFVLIRMQEWRLLRTMKN